MEVKENLIKGEIITWNDKSVTEPRYYRYKNENIEYSDNLIDWRLSNKNINNEDFIGEWTIIDKK